MNKITLQRLSDQYQPRAVKSAVDKLTIELDLTVLNGRKLVNFVGTSEAALDDYEDRLRWLRKRHKKIKAWIEAANRSDVQLAVCNSIFATHEHYGMILNSLVKSATSRRISEQAQTALLDFGTIRSGEVRYVRNYD